MMRSIQAYSKRPSSGSHRLHVDSPTRTTLSPACSIKDTSFSRRSAGMYSSQNAAPYKKVSMALGSNFLAGVSARTLAMAMSNSKDFLARRGFISDQCMTEAAQASYIRDHRNRPAPDSSKRGAHP